MLKRISKSLYSKLLIGAVIALPASYWVYQRATHVYTDDARIAADMIDVRSKVSGWLVDIPVSSGDYLTKGSLIAKLDTREVDLQVREIQSQLSAQQAEKRRAEFELTMVTQQSGGNIDAARSNLNAARAELLATESDLQFRTNEWSRAQSLRTRKIISLKDWERDRLAWQQADQQYQQSLAAVASAEAHLVEADASGGHSLAMEQDVARIAHNIESISLQLQQKQVRQLDHQVLAPNPGIVDKLFADPGEYVIPGQRLLLMHNPNSIWVAVNIRETSIDDIEVGQPVSVRVDAYPDLEFNGTVEKVGHAATSQFSLLPSANPSGNFTKVTQRLPVKVAIEQREELLKPGMMVEVSIDVRSP
jgi:membrane fusion protein (multidrug efflux system)